MNATAVSKRLLEADAAAEAPEPEEGPPARLDPSVLESRPESFLNRLFQQGEEDPWTTHEAVLELEPLADEPPEEDEEAPVDEGHRHEEVDFSNPLELRRIAATAGGTTLKKILRSGNPNVLLVALNNPGLKIEDVIKLAKSPKAPDAVLAEISRRRNWSGDLNLARELCLNPKTPYHASRWLVSRMPVSMLREIVTSPGVPPQLTKDALQAIDKKRTRRT